MSLSRLTLSLRDASTQRLAAFGFLLVAASLQFLGCTNDAELRAAATLARPSESSATAAPSSAPSTAARLRLVDVGADRCVPCRAMAPILEELRVQKAEQLEVIFVDAWKNPAAGASYGVQIIPTQIFYDREGKELWRHQGFLSKSDILANWKRLGYDLEAATSTEQGKKG